MNEEKQLTIYIGIIQNEFIDTKTFVKAINEAEARKMILEKYKDSLDVYFQEGDVSVLRFSDVYGR